MKIGKKKKKKKEKKVRNWCQTKEKLGAFSKLLS